MTPKPPNSGRSGGPNRGSGGPQRGSGGPQRGSGSSRNSGPGGVRSGGGRVKGSGPVPKSRDNTPQQAMKAKPEPSFDVHDPSGTRLQKLLASAGFGSRRACEKLIEQGRVTVDGVRTKELGTRVDPVNQIVHVDGTRVVFDDTKVYLAFNKPLGVVSTMNDDLGRVSLSDYVGQRNERLFHVGRLDADTEGLLLLTNDGDLAHQLQHPAYGVPKTYVAQVRGPVGRDVGAQLRAGVELEDGKASVDSFKLVDSLPGKAIVELVIHEGRNHVVRRMLDAVGYPVLALARTQVGPVRLGELKPGRSRALTKEEVGGLHRAAGM